ncbi:MAG: hypothetical protein JW395_0273 [Nitrospira sp.]|nr:hypothetical protein [Nitrospira sp.]
MGPCKAFRVLAKSFDNRHKVSKERNLPFAIARGRIRTQRHWQVVVDSRRRGPNSDGRALCSVSESQSLGDDPGVHVYRASPGHDSKADHRSERSISYLCQLTTLERSRRETPLGLAQQDIVTKRIEVKCQHVRVAGRVVCNVEQGMRLATFGGAVLYEVLKRNDARREDVRILREVPIVVEQRVRRPPFHPPLQEIMHKRVDSSRCNVRVLSQIVPAAE